MAMHCMKLFEMSGLSKLNPQPLPLSIVLCLLCVALTLSILSFMLYFLPIPCLNNVVLCLLCVPLATSVYSILSFMLYFCHSFAHIVYIALLCLLCVLTPVLPGHININQSFRFLIRKTEKTLKNEQRSKDAAAKKRLNTSGVGKINNYYEDIYIPPYINNTD